jgi:hypothetical protein
MRLVHVRQSTHRCTGWTPGRMEGLEKDHLRCQHRHCKRRRQPLERPACQLEPLVLLAMRSHNSDWP